MKLKIRYNRKTKLFELVKAEGFKESVIASDSEYTVLFLAKKEILEKNAASHT